MLRETYATVSWLVLFYAFMSLDNGHSSVIRRRHRVRCSKLSFMEITLVLDYAFFLLLGFLWCENMILFGLQIFQMCEIASSCVLAEALFCAVHYMFIIVSPIWGCLYNSLSTLKLRYVVHLNAIVILQKRSRTLLWQQCSKMKITS